MLVIFTDTMLSFNVHLIPTNNKYKVIHQILLYMKINRCFIEKTQKCLIFGIINNKTL